MKSFAKLAVAGFSTVVLFKLFATVLIPILGLLFGLMALTVKLALVAAVAYFIYSMLRRRSDARTSDVDVEVEEILEVEEVEETTPEDDGEGE